MGDVVNLRMARKQKARAGREKLAAENRLNHGRSKSDRVLREQIEAREKARLDAHRREVAPDSGGQKD